MTELLSSWLCFLSGQGLLTQRNDDGGHKQVSESPLSVQKLLEDEALFNLGLIFAHFRNPQKDLEKSLVFFKSLTKNYPKSPFVEQAKMWVGILEENEALDHLIQKLRQVDIEIEEMKRKKTQ